MTERRHTADTITDDALDELYDRLAAAEQRAENFEGRASAFEQRTKKAERAVTLLADAHQRAGQAEAAIERVRRMTNILATTQTPVLDPDSVRALLLRALDEPKEGATS